MTDDPGRSGSDRRSLVAVGVCRVCGEVFDRRRYRLGKVVGINATTKTCAKHRWLRKVGEVLVDKDTPYRRDVACQLFVATFRGGATLDAIAEAIGVSRERVRQIEGEAIAKLQGLGLPAFGVDPDDPDERRDGRPRHDEPGGLDDADEGEAPPDDDGADDASGPDLAGAEPDLEREPEPGNSDDPRGAEPEPA